MTTTPVYASPVPAPPRVNVRLIGFMGAIAAVFVAVFVVYLRGELSGGISKHGDYAEVDLKALGNFPFDERIDSVNAVPARFRELDGQRVVLDGFMWSPNYAGPKASEFQFVYNVSKCCFGGPPKVQERVFARARDGVESHSYTEFLKLTGILHVRVVRDDAGVVTSVFDLDVEKLESVG